jgi:hypothetical protein
MEKPTAINKFSGEKKLQTKNVSGMICQIYCIVMNLYLTLSVLQTGQ